MIVKKHLLKMDNEGKLIDDDESEEIRDSTSPESMFA